MKKHACVTTRLLRDGTRYRAARRAGLLPDKRRRINKLKQSPVQIGEVCKSSTPRITGTSILWNSSRDVTPTGHRQPTRGRRNEKFRQSPAKKSIGTRYHCLLEGGTSRLVQGYSSVGIRVRATSLSGERGVPGDEVPLLRCDGREHATCASVSSTVRADQPAPAPGTRALPHT